MEPLIPSANAIEPLQLHVLEKRSQDRELPRRKRRKAAGEEELDQEPGPDAPKHAVDDLA